MARIRTIKPELLHSESLASVSLTAERTFIGLLTQADDVGRYRDHPAILAGQLWPLRPEHTALDVEEDLAQLQSEGLICRYTGCDGRGYLHLVNWAKHQKIDRPSASRTPRCPVHQLQQGCGECKDACGHQTPHSTENARSNADAAKARRGLASPARPDPAPAEPGPAADAPVTGAESATPRGSDERAGQGTFVEPSRGMREDSSSGSRILDPGSIPTGRGAPALGSVSARDLIGEYIVASSHRPPEKVLGHLGREVRSLLDEGFEPGQIRTALERLRVKGLHPSALASLVNEALNATPATSGGRGGYTPWMNPTDASVYEEAL